MTLPMAPSETWSMVCAAIEGVRRSNTPTMMQATRCFSGLPLFTKYSMDSCGPAVFRFDAVLASEFSAAMIHLDKCVAIVDPASHLECCEFGAAF
ncbi:MAG: hypothetical protein Q8K85_22855 [Hyphomicrobium sp.]|nr:hypothetical protein [Hyphomicrobium sp.]